MRELMSERTGGFLELLREFRRHLDAELQEFLESKRRGLADAGSAGGGSGAPTRSGITAGRSVPAPPRELDGRPPAGTDLADVLASLILAGGKRLRPALVHFTYLACGGTSPEEVLPLAMSAELLHTYLLVHDDIMDHSGVRRGQPTAQVRFGERHARNGWPGDPADFGRSMAILLGDLAHTWAAELFAESRIRAEARLGEDGTAALNRAFSAMCEQVVVGQYLEMHLLFRESPSEDELLRVLRLKSGYYSVERPMRLGGLLAGARGKTLARLAAYGTAVGEAFQLQDDVLGVFGDADAIGKPVGSDLAEGKVTFLVHHTLGRAGPGERRRLRQILGRGTLEPEAVQEARAIMRDAGGLGAVRAMIEERLEAAGRVLESLPLESEGRRFLEGLIAYSRERDR